MKNRLCVALGAVLLSVPALGKSPQLVLGGSMGGNTMKGKFKASYSDGIDGNPQNIPDKKSKTKSSFQGEFSAAGRFFPHDSFFLGPDLALALLSQNHNVRLNHGLNGRNFFMDERIRRRFAFKPGLVLGGEFGKMVLGVKVGATTSRYKIKLHEISDNIRLSKDHTHTGFAGSIFGEYALTKAVSATVAVEYERIQFKHTFKNIDPAVAQLNATDTYRVKYRTRGANIKAGVVYKVGA